MSKRNFAGKADRGNKLAKENLRGLSGGHYGPAGPVTRIDPATVRPIAPPKVSHRYMLYAAAERSAGRIPKLPRDWYRSLTKPKRKQALALTPAVRAHQRRPYGGDPADKFDDIERLYKRD